MSIAEPPLRLPDVVEPLWATGEARLNPADIVIDAERSTAEGTVPQSLAAAMVDQFDDIGVVHVTNTGLTDLAAMRRLAKVVLSDEMAYTGGANPRNTLGPNVYEVGAPPEAWLHYHHEMAYIGQSTSRIAFLCKHALADRGHTYVSDNVQATDALLATPFGQRLRDRGICYRRDLTDRSAYGDNQRTGVYNHWQQSLGTDDPFVAEARANERGLHTEWLDNGLLRTRYYISAFEHFGGLDRNLLFSSVADHAVWFDNWPHLRHLPNEERPLEITYGDGSPLSDQDVLEWVHVYDRFGTPICWSQGDVAIVCNYRFAHGRPGIELASGEQRELGVMLGASFDRVGDKPHRW